MMNSENFSELVEIRDALLVAALKYNRRGIMKHQIDIGQRGDYAVYTFRRASGLLPQTTDDVQAAASEALGRKVYQDPQYTPGVVATYRVKLETL